MREVRSSSHRDQSRGKPGGRFPAPTARPVARATVAATILAVLGAACGSGTSSTTSDGASASATAHAAAHFSGTYHLLLLAPLTSGAAGLGASPEIATGALAAAKQINAAGGVNGHQIKVTICDTKGIPANAISCAHEAVSDKVLAVVGSNDSSGEYLPILQAGGVPDVAPDAVEKELISPDAWSIASAIPLIDGAAVLLARQGIKDIADPFPDLPGYAQLTSAILAPVEKDLHLKITNIPVEPDEADYAPVVAAAEQHQGIMTTLTPTQLVPFMQAYAQSGSKVPVATVTLDPPTVKALGSAGNGLEVPLQFLPPSLTANPAVARFDKAMNAVDPSADKDIESENAYSSVELVAAEIKGMTPVTSRALVRKLNSTTDVNLGLLPPVQFTKPSTVFSLFPRIFNTSVIFAKAENGDLVATNATFRNIFTGAVVAKLPS
jgi:branched-chain amino acid transport system substrate-binding protein